MIKLITKYCFLVLFILNITTILVCANPPIDPIKFNEKLDKTKFSFSVTYIPVYVNSVILKDNFVYNYLKSTNTVKYSFFSQYHLNDKLSFVISPNYYRQYEKKYLNEVLIENVKKEEFDINFGVRYELINTLFSPSIEMNLVYPGKTELGISGNIIRDPIILLLGLNYKNNYAEKMKKISVNWGVGFVANDKISFKFVLNNVYPNNKIEPAYSSISLFTNYSLDSENEKRIVLENSFVFNNSEINVINGIKYVF